jgi:hypothetical protein
VHHSADFLGEASMKCEACGLERGVSHTCPAAISPEVQRILEEGLRAPADGGIEYYAGEALKILRWDDEAIRRNATDPRVTGYGLLFLFAAIVVLVGVPKIAGLNAQLPDWSQTPFPYGVVAGLPFGVVGILGLSLLQAGVCFLIAKWFLGGKGKFVEVLRPLMMVWFVNCLTLWPGKGMLYGAIAWTIVLMMVFEEVTGITRMQAFCICAAVNFIVFAVQFEMIPVTHHY